MKLKFAILFTFLIQIAFAQLRERQMWLQVQLSKELKKNFTIGAQYRLRLDNDMTHYRGSNIYGTLGYKINKYLSTQFTYRYYTSRIKDEHTFFVSMTGGYKIKDFKISLRTAYQNVNEYFARNYEPGHEPLHQWRNRLTLKYDITKKWDVYISAEPYILFNERGAFLQRVRASAGVDWQFYKYNTINLFYIFQPDYYRTRPQWTHVLGISYEIDLPKKFKKKKGKDNGKSDKPDSDI